MGGLSGKPHLSGARIFANPVATNGISQGKKVSNPVIAYSLHVNNQTQSLLTFPGNLPGHYLAI